MVAMKLFKQHPGRSCERTRAGPFRRNDRGVAAIEFALILPILALLLLGCFEVPKLVLLYQKIARTSSGVRYDVSGSRPSTSPFIAPSMTLSTLGGST